MSVPGPVTNTPKATFLSLPGELRNKIYSYALYPCTKVIWTVFTTTPQDFCRTLLKHPLFRTSRQLRAECLSFYCANKIFNVYNFRCARIFMEGIGPSGRASLAHLSLVLTQIPRDTEDAHAFITLLKEAGGLRHMRIALDATFEVDERTTVQVNLLKILKGVVEKADGLQFSWMYPIHKNDRRDTILGRDEIKRAESFREVVTGIFGNEEPDARKEEFFAKGI